MVLCAERVVVWFVLVVAVGSPGFVFRVQYQWLSGLYWCSLYFSLALCFRCRSSGCLFLDGLIAVDFLGFVLRLFLDGGRCRFPWLCVSGANRVVVCSRMV